MIDVIAIVERLSKALSALADETGHIAELGDDENAAVLRSAIKLLGKLLVVCDQVLEMVGPPTPHDAPRVAELRRLVGELAAL